MSTIFNLLSRLVTFLVSALGFVVWIGGAVLLAALVISQNNAAGDGAMAYLRMALVGAGAFLAIVGSVVMLRLTHHIVPFLVCLAFGAVAFLGGGLWQPMYERSLVGAGTAAPATTEAPAAEAPANGEQSAAQAEAEKQVAQEAAAPRAAPDGKAVREEDGIAAPAPPPPPVFAPRSLAPGAAMRAQVARPPAAAAPPIAAPAAPSAGSLAAPSGGGGGASVATRSLESQAPAPKSSDFHLAELKFNKPDEMQLDKAYVVDAIIGAPGAEAPATLGDVGRTETRQTMITRKVRVELVANDFDITPLHKIDTVLVTAQNPGHWSWRVIPRREGVDRKMLLQVFGVLEQNGVAQGEIMIKTYEEKILVKVTPMKRVQLVSQALTNAWQPIAGALAAIGGVWVFFTRLVGALRKRNGAAASAA
jgi:hypothetical protein